MSTIKIPTVSEVIEDLRQIYLRNPATTNIDWFERAPGKFVVESSMAYFDASDESGFKTMQTLDYDSATAEFTPHKATAPEDLSVLLQKNSHNGKYKVLLKASKTGMIIEIYDQEGLHYRHAVPPTVHMGLIRKSAAYVTDGIVWSQDENRFMYMADDPKAMLNMFKLKEKGVFRYRFEDIPGERLQAHTFPSIFIFDIASKTHFRVQKPTEIYNKTRSLYAMPQFANPEGTSLVCVSIEMQDIFEMAFFTNYAKKMEYLSGLEIKNVDIDFLKAQYIKPIAYEFDRATTPESIVYYPRISPDFKTCCYLFATELMAASANVFGLRTFSLEDLSKAPETIVDIVKEDLPEFSGIMGMNYHLNSYCWLDNQTILVTSYLRQTTQIFEVSIATKAVRRVSKKIYLEGESPIIIGSLNQNNVLLKLDTHVRNGNLFVLRREADGSYRNVILHKPLTDHENFFEETIVLNGIESHFFGRKSEEVPLEKRGVLLYIHGGPHNIYLNIFNPLAYYLTKIGYTILNVNFTGSSGRGQDFMIKLHEKPGNITAQEMYETLQHLISLKKCDPKNVAFLCGSYGGALGVYYLSLYPDSIKAMSIFNPPLEATSLQLETVFPGIGQSMVLKSNIQANPKDTFTYDQVLKMNSSDYSAMWLNQKYSTEVLLFGGLKDTVVTRGSNRRVYKMMRENGNKIDLIEYPDEEHFILIPKNTYDYVVKTALLFQGLWKFDQ